MSVKSSDIVKTVIEVSGDYSIREVQADTVVRYTPESSASVLTLGESNVKTGVNLDILNLSEYSCTISIGTYEDITLPAQSMVKVVFDGVSWVTDRINTLLGDELDLANVPTQYYAPVSGEPSAGPPIPLAMSKYSANFHLNGVTVQSYPETSPYVWDISSYVPEGTAIVYLELLLQAVTTVAQSAARALVWDYDLGALTDTIKHSSHAMMVRTSKIVASDYTYDYLQAVNSGLVAIGSSRKLYVGGLANSSLFKLYADVKHYSLG